MFKKIILTMILAFVSSSVYPKETTYWAKPENIQFYVHIRDKIDQKIQGEIKRHIEDTLKKKYGYRITQDKETADFILYVDKTITKENSPFYWDWEIFDHQTREGIVTFKTAKGDSANSAVLNNIETLITAFKKDMKDWDTYGSVIRLVLVDNIDNIYKVLNAIQKSPEYHTLSEHKTFWMGDIDTSDKNKKLSLNWYSVLLGFRGTVKDVQNFEMDDNGTKRKLSDLYNTEIIGHRIILIIKPKTKATKSQLKDMMKTLDKLKQKIDNKRES